MEFNPEVMSLWEIISLAKEKIMETGDYGHPASAEVERLELLLHGLEHLYKRVPAYIGNQS